LTYTAKKDDSLWTVAKKYDVSVGELACANNLPTTAKIKEGQKLVIPPGGFLAPAGDAKRYGPAAGKKADTAAHAATAKKADTHAKAEPKKDSPPAAAAPAAPKGQIEYEIKKNDTPATIAAKYKVKVEAILAANKGLDPAKLQIGKKIIIPGATAPAAASPAQTPAHAKTVAATAPKTPAPPSADKAAPKSPAPAQPSKDAAAAADLLKSKPGKSADDIIKGMQQPGAAAAAPSETVETVVSAPASGNAETIDIEEDITVQNLAEQYGVKIDDIVKLNPALKPGATVKAGSKVKLP
jgi:LysM repeat protein